MRTQKTIGQWTSAILHTRTGMHSLDIKLADTFLTRFKGLMFARPLAPNVALLITRCSSVHTAFVRQAIDVAYLDQAGKVLKCVSKLKPWRGSASNIGKDDHGMRYRRATHTLEFAAGTIERLQIQAGDQLVHPLWQDVTPSSSRTLPVGARHQRGSAMIEFAVVGPVMTLLGLAVLQYGMLFFAKNQINYAAFMAARAGSMGNANLGKVQRAYAKALVPLYGGGTNKGELKAALGKGKDDVAKNVRIDMLNPTKESFDDWNDPVLQRTIGKGKGKGGADARVIPNVSLAFKNQDSIGRKSGQSIQDANLIKLRITHGYEPKVPLIRSMYAKYLQWLDPKTDAFHTKLVNAGRIPVVTHITLQMQSDAIEPKNPVSTPGTGNNGNPTDPGDPPVVATDPPNCLTVGCSVITIQKINPTPPSPSHCVNGVCTVCS